MNDVEPGDCPRKRKRRINPSPNVDYATEAAKPWADWRPGGPALYRPIWLGFSPLPPASAAAVASRHGCALAP